MQKTMKQYTDDEYSKPPISYLKSFNEGSDFERFQRVIYPGFFKEADLGSYNGEEKACAYDCEGYNGNGRSELACNGTVHGCKTADYIDSCIGNWASSTCIAFSRNKHIIYNLNWVN